MSYTIYVPVLVVERDYEVSVRQLTACENMGNHHIYISVVDQAGNGLNGIPVEICWSQSNEDCARPVTQSIKGVAGSAEFSMFIDDYYVTILEGVSFTVGPITSAIDVDEECEETGTIGNYLYHYSYEVVFTRTQ